jgi:hypothetical protein
MNDSSLSFTLEDDQMNAVADAIRWGQTSPFSKPARKEDELLRKVRAAITSTSTTTTTTTTTIPTRAPSPPRPPPSTPAQTTGTNTFPSLVQLPPGPFVDGEVATALPLPADHVEAVFGDHSPVVGARRGVQAQGVRAKGVQLQVARGEARTTGTNTFPPLVQLPPGPFVDGEVATALSLPADHVEAVRAVFGDHSPVVGALRSVQALGVQLRVARGDVERLEAEVIELKVAGAAGEVTLADMRAEMVRLRGKVRALEQGSDMAALFQRYESEVARLEARLRGVPGGDAGGDGSVSQAEARAAERLQILQGKVLDDACAKLGAAARQLAAKEEALVAQSRACKIAEDLAISLDQENTSLKAQIAALREELRGTRDHSRSLKTSSKTLDTAIRSLASRLPATQPPHSPSSQEHNHLTAVPESIRDCMGKLLPSLGAIPRAVAVAQRLQMAIEKEIKVLAERARKEIEERKDIEMAVRASLQTFSEVGREMVSIAESLRPATAAAGQRKP